jgi:hypothetical protein
MTIEQLITTAKSTIAGAKDALEKFSAAVLENPEHAMLRSSTLFTHTASTIVWNEILNNAEGGATLENIAKSLDEHIFYAATNPPHSSSQLSNYLEVEKTRVRAEASKYIRRLVSIAENRAATASS